MSNWDTAIIDEFRQNSGKVGGQFEGAPLQQIWTVQNAAYAGFAEYEAAPTRQVPFVSLSRAV